METTTPLPTATASAPARSGQGWRAYAKRFVVNTLTVWPMLGVYLFINHHPSSTPPLEVPMPAWVPFWPAFFLPYAGLLLVTWLLPVAIRDAGRFRACLQANVCAILLVAPWWVLTPTLLPRPPLPDGVWGGFLQWLWLLDRPANVLPCAHGIGPVVAAWFVLGDRPTWRWPLILMLAVGLPSIALTWQHRPVDIFLGTVAAVIGIIVGEKFRRRSHPIS